MTSNVELQRVQGEKQAEYLERLRAALRARRADAQAEYELKRHLDDTLVAMRQSGAPSSARIELQKQLTQTCIRLGAARGQVDIAESLLVVALNAD